MKALRKGSQIETQVAILAGIMIAVILLLALLLGDSFFSLLNFQSMGYQIPEFGFLAIAMTLAMLTGGIDLSVVATANLSGIIAAFFLTGRLFVLPPGGHAGPLVILSIFVALSVAGLCGFLNGLIVARLAVPPILATLGTGILFSGIGMAVTNGEGIVGFPQEFEGIGSGAFLEIPIPLILFIAAIIIFGFLLARTVFGRKLYLLGENPAAAVFCGINNKRTLVVTYLLCGLLSGCSSIIMISRVNSARVGYGDSYLLQAILVAVLGGINPDGGYGKLSGVVIGIIILQCLQNAFTLFSFTPYAKRLIWGAMLLLVMIVSFLTLRSNGKKSGPAARTG